MSVVVVTEAGAWVVDVVVVVGDTGTVVDVVVVVGADTGIVVDVVVVTGAVVVVVMAEADQRAYSVTLALLVGVYVAPRAVPPVDEVNQPSNW